MLWGEKARPLEGQVHVNIAAARRALAPRARTAISGLGLLGEYRMHDQRPPLELGTARLVYPVWPKIFRALPILFAFAVYFGLPVGVAMAALYVVALRAAEAAPRTLGRWAPVALVVALAVYFVLNNAVGGGVIASMGVALALELLQSVGTRLAQMLATRLLRCPRDEDTGIRDLLRAGEVVRIAPRQVNRRLQLVFFALVLAATVAGIAATLPSGSPVLKAVLWALALGSLYVIVFGGRLVGSAVIARDSVTVESRRFPMQAPQKKTVYLTQVLRLKITPFHLIAYGRKGVLFALPAMLLSPYEIGLLVQFLSGRRDEDGDTDVSGALVFQLALIVLLALAVAAAFGYLALMRA